MLDLRHIFPEIEEVSETYEILFGIYKGLEEQFGENNITIKCHNSGFPSIIVCVNHKPVFITDRLSVEEYFKFKKEI